MKNSLTFVLLVVTSAFAVQQSSVTQYGITWTFDKDYEVGQFVNGDYWVLGPVTIASVSPAWDGEKNGTMIDPVPSTKQGYRVGLDLGFDESLRASFPRALSGTNSVISTIGLPEVNPGGSHEGIKTAAILTVVSEVPPATAFRPAYISCGKQQYTTDQIRYDLLPTITRPSPATIPSNNYMQMPWIDHAGIRGNASGAIHPTDNMPPYYFGVPAATQALLCFLDDPMRDTWLIRFLQFGIDTYENCLQNGDAFISYGGFGKSRKWPVLFAGIMLDDENMKNPPDSVGYNGNPVPNLRKFSEDGHTYYGAATTEYPDGKPLWGMECFDWGHYESYCINGGSGNKDCRDPDGLVDNCSGYLEINSKTYVGEALAARIMGAEELWGWDAFFDYVDRYVTRTLDISLKFGNTFIAFMWNTYRSQVPIAPVSDIRIQPEVTGLPFLGIPNPVAFSTLKSILPAMELYSIKGIKIPEAPASGQYLVRPAAGTTMYPVMIVE